MNKFILEELKECRIANILPYDENSTEVKIEGQRKPTELLFGQYYSIELENYIVNPPPNFDLAENWNNGTKPSSKYMNVELVQTLGKKMVKISGVCLPDQKFWAGWVPRKSIVKIEEVK